MTLSFINKSKLKKELILWHCAGWILFSLYDNLDTFFFASNFQKARLLNNQILLNFYNIGASIVIFYSLVFFLHLFFNGKKIAAIIGVVSIFVISYFLNYVASGLSHTLGLGDLPVSEYERIIFIGAIQFFVPLFMFALAYVLALSIVGKQKQIISLQRENARKEAENKNKEIQNILLQNAFLRAQINPHFLYNTLNFFYAHSLQYSDELSDGILTLSEIMRYSLRRSLGKGQEKVLLSDEIEHIKNIIKINRLRYKNNIFINFEIIGNTDDIYILPFVLITITENVFKHGEINNPQYPAIIKLSVEKERVQLYCHDKKKGGVKEPGTGIGLENTRQRLKYEYGNNFSLTSRDENGFFTTEMHIDFDSEIKNETI